MIGLLAIIFMSFGIFAVFTSLGSDKTWTWVCGAISVISFAILLGLAVWSNTCRTYEMHDVTVRLYYLDGSQEVRRFSGLHRDEPYLDCRGRIPFFCAGSVEIPCVSRFETIDERKYEVTGRELLKGGAL